MSRISRIMFVISLASIAAPVSLLAGTTVREGMWRVTSTTEMPGSSMKLKPVTLDKCVSKEDAADPEKSLPQGPGKGCKFSDYKADGNKVTWKMDCPEPTPVTGSGVLTYESDSAYKAVLKLLASGHSLVMTLEGHRIGDCK